MHVAGRKLVHHFAPAQDGDLVGQGHDLAEFVGDQGLSTNEKRELVVFLEAQGTFAIRNGVGYVCGVLAVSRATIYNWLKQQREA